MIRNISWLSIGLIGALVAVGCSGSDGDDGADGAVGPQGPAGPTGPIGPSGSTGATGAEGPAGPEGPAGQDAVGTVSISGVSPGSAFLGRVKTVGISGFGTDWSTTTPPAVSFGDDIVVDSVSVASPTALMATITVAHDAEVGLRTVTVGDGTETLAYTDSFLIESPVKFGTIGTVAQGSILDLVVTNRDFETPFDTTHTGDGLFSPIVYTNLQLSDVPGFMGPFDEVESYRATALMLVDVDTTPGETDFEILSGPAGYQDRFAAPKALNVAQREPIAITIGTPKIAKIAEAFGSQVFKLQGSTTEAQMITVDVSASKTGSQPAFALLPASGKFADLIAYTDKYTLQSSPTASVFYLVFWDNTGTYNYDFTFATSASAVFIVADTEPNNTAATAVVAGGLPVYMPDATLSSVSDQDWIKVEATGADVGKRFRMVTSPGQDYCDTVVAAYGSDGATLLGTESPNNNYHENHLSAAIPAAGTYYIRVSADQTGYFNPTYNKYNLTVTLE